MGKLKFILTADYEVFGNGSGCIDHCVLHPTEEMVSICEFVDARMTFFVDVCEYWAFKEVKAKGEFPVGYDPAKTIETQVKDLIKRGHDVQLHFHPQWMDYKFLQKEEWILNEDYWRLAEFPKLGKGTMLDLFQKGKETLEEMIRPIKPDYVCDVFRAGAWCIQPEKEVLDAMNTLGFKIESTVAPGMSFDDGTTMYNFEKAPQDLPYWMITNNVQENNQEGKIKEIPIFTDYISGLKVFQFTFIKALRKIPFKPRGCVNNGYKAGSKSMVSKVFDALQSQHRMFNFCDATSSDELKYMVQRAYKKYKQQLKDQDVPIVLIGHPKTFGNPREFKKFMIWATRKNYIEFSTYQEFK